MSLVTVQRSSESTSSTPGSTSPSKEDNSFNRSTHSATSLKPPNFKDLKAIYSSSAKTIDDSAKTLTPTKQNTLIRKTMSNKLNEKPKASLENFASKRASLNSIDTSTKQANDFKFKTFHASKLKTNQEEISKKQTMNKPKSEETLVRIGSQTESISIQRLNRDNHLIEKYFVVKDAALIIPRRSSSNSNLSQLTNLAVKESSSNESISSISNLSQSQIETNNNSADPSFSSSSTGDILIHLQNMISLLRPNDTIILAVKLCSYIQERLRYLVIVETTSNSNESSCEESAILGFDLQPVMSSQIEITNENRIEQEQNEKEELKKTTKNESRMFTCSIGLVLPIYASCEISLDGDGGFKFKSHLTTHIFKPVSIQAMWSAYQYLHKALENARKFNFYSIATMSSSPNLLQHQNSSDLLSFNTTLQQSINTSNPPLDNHEWTKYYSILINKNKVEQTVNEWYQKEERSAQREDFTTPYFDSLQLCKEQEETGIKIKEKLREIMISSKDDYGSMSSVYIREILEKELQLNLENFKKFIDATIFQFYNQLVECATQILPYLYLGTEWNASNYDSLVQDKVTHILNVSSEVDNFFPDAFKYLNIRVLDVDETDLLKEFDRTNKFIQEAKEQGTSCLVHCKMGVSRSASVVLAYLMKEFNWNYQQAFNFSKQKRNCINPNDSFKQQLATYESILNAHRAKYNLFEPQLLNTEQTSLIIQTQTNSSSLINENLSLPSVKDAVIKIKTSIEQLNNNNLPLPNSQTGGGPLISPKGYGLSASNLYNSVEQIPPVSPKSKYNQQQKQQTSSSLNTVSNNNPNSSLKYNKSISSNVVLKIDENLDDSSLKSENEKITNNNNHQHHFHHQHYRSKSFSNYSGEKYLKSDHGLNRSIKSNSVKRLVEEYMKENTNTSNEENLTTHVTFTNTNNQETSFTFLLPIGIVKRQVDSINFKSKPLESHSPNEGSDTCCKKVVTFSNDDLNFEFKKKQTISPDSKRFKCELLDNQIKISKSKIETEFNRSKKVFEKLGDENNEKLHHQQSMFRSNSAGDRNSQTSRDKKNY